MATAQTQDTTLEQMLRTHPSHPQLDPVMLQCLKACFECAQACVACADACLGEPKLDMLRRCIRLNQDCANVCEATGKVLARHTQPEPAIVRAMLQACVVACGACGEECGKHAQEHAHCRVCADACKRCEDACNKLLQAA